MNLAMGKDSPATLTSGSLGRGWLVACARNKERAKPGKLEKGLSGSDGF